MVVRSYEKLSRKTIVSNVLKNTLFGLPKPKIDFNDRLLQKPTFALFVQSCEKLCRKTFDRNVIKKRYFNSPWSK